MSENPIIEIDGLSFSYQNQDKQVLKDINLKIHPGTITLVCGPTGSGKTTLIRLFNGLIPHFHEGKMTGTVKIAGMDTVKTQTSRLAQVVGMVFQNPDNQLISSSCDREIVFGPENLGLPREEIKERLESTIQLLGLEEIRDKSPTELSGGQKQKVAIAAMLALQPDVLVFDEPSSNLDVSSSINLFQIIKTINESLNTTIIIVEHRLELFLQIATHVICVDDGRIILHDEKEKVIQDDRFHGLGIQIPVILKLFKKLHDKSFFSGNLPITSREGIDILRELV
ncbi:MAG: energy-coupling factor ABC transporter ATP-binding protein [Candidatus Hodarchaeota archaeon]